ncbi:MAG: PilZ domain-containing protein [Pseudomonadota bacterium]
MSDHSGRRHQRARVPLLVQYRFSPVGDYLTDYSANLSRGGMFIVTDQPRPVGSILYIQFVTRDGSRIIRGQGRIVRSVAQGEGAQERIGHAVEFLDFDADDTRFVEDLVQRALDEQGQPAMRVGRRGSVNRDPGEGSGS